MLHMKICKPSIDFKISLEWLLWSIDHRKTTFWPLQNPETIANNFDIFFRLLCPICLLTYMEMEYYSGDQGCWGFPKSAKSHFWGKSWFLRKIQVFCYGSRGLPRSLYCTGMCSRHPQWSFWWLDKKLEKYCFSVFQCIFIIFVTWLHFRDWLVS